MLQLEYYISMSANLVLQMQKNDSAINYKDSAINYSFYNEISELTNKYWQIYRDHVQRQEILLMFVIEEDIYKKRITDSF